MNTVYGSMWAMCAIILFLLVSHVTASSSHVLHKIYDARLFEMHEVHDEVSSIVDTHHAGVLSRQSDSIIPILGCGPSVEYHEKRDELLRVASFADIATVLHADNESCIVTHVKGSFLNSFNDDEWTFAALPPLLKIHQSVLHHMTNFRESRRLAAEEKTTDDIDLEFEPLTTPLPQGESLSVQFVPGSVPSVQEAMGNVLEQWHQQGHLWVMQDSDIGGLPVVRGQGKWQQLRDAAVSLNGASSSVPCTLPASTLLEYDSSFGRIVDLSGWSDEDAATNSLCLLSLVEAFSADPSVLSVSVQGRPVLLNYDARGVAQSGVSYNTPFSSAGMFGAGQVVGVADSGLDDYSCFFLDKSGEYSSTYTYRSSANNAVVEKNRRKVVMYVSYGDAYDQAVGHGTHVVGTIVGNSVYGEFSGANGVAPGAKVAFFDVMAGNSQYLSIPDLNTVFSSMYSAGARVMSNSWGSFSAESSYSDRSYSADSYLNDNMDVLVIFAAGNSGQSGYHTAYNPCTSKNVLCVGSVDLRDDQADSVVTSSESRVSYFSSLGPSFDGRIKPELTAPGYKIVSALSAGPQSEIESCAVYETFGTSMATPVVAGMALLLREYFLNVYPQLCSPGYGACTGESITPSGYLLKAVLLHTAQPVASYSTPNFDGKTTIASYTLGTPPDSVQGYGMVNLHSIVPLSSSEQKEHNFYVMDKLNVPMWNVYMFTVEVTSSKKPLRVTIAWYDYVSAVGQSSSLLIRNLDLRVVKQKSGHEWHGNGVENDSLNPQEQVHIESPDTGVYQVYISGSSAMEVNAAIVVTCAGSVTSEPARFIENADVDAAVESQAPLETTARNAVPVSKSPNLRVSASASSVIVKETQETSADEHVIDAMPPVESAAAPKVRSNGQAAYEQMHFAENERILPATASYSRTDTIPVDTDLDPMTETCIWTYTTTSSADQLYSVTMDLNANYHGGSAAFILAILVYAPNEEVLQIGGYQNYLTSHRLWNRMWPVQWTASTTPYGGGSHWTATRYVLDANLRQVGDWTVCLKIMYSNWETTHYDGTITMHYVDSSTLDSYGKAKEDDGGVPLSGTGLFLLVFFLALAAAVSVGLAIRKREEIVAAVKRAGGGQSGSSRSGNYSAKAATSTGIMAPRRNPVAGSLAMPSIKRKAQTSSSNDDKGDETAASLLLTSGEGKIPSTGPGERQIGSPSWSKKGSEGGVSSGGGSGKKKISSTEGGMLASMTALRKPRYQPM